MTGKHPSATQIARNITGNDKLESNNVNVIRVQGVLDGIGLASRPDSLIHLHLADKAVHLAMTSVGVLDLATITHDALAAAIDEVLPPHRRDQLPDTRAFPRRRAKPRSLRAVPTPTATRVRGQVWVHVGRQAAAPAGLQ